MGVGPLVGIGMRALVEVRSSKEPGVEATCGSPSQADTNAAAVRLRVMTTAVNLADRLGPLGVLSFIVTPIGSVCF